VTVIMNDEWGGMWKEMIVEYLEILSPGGCEENFANLSQKLCRCDNPSQWIYFMTL